MSNLALQLARRFKPRHVLIALGTVIVSFAALDFLFDRALDSLVAFHLDDSNPAVQNSFPAIVLAMILASAGALALAVAGLRDTGAPGPWRAAALALFIVAVDEALGLHTWLNRQFDVSWYVAHLPLVALAGAAWVGAARAMSAHRRAQMTFAAGIGAWALAAVLDPTRTGRAEAPVAVELLEMAAATLLLVGLLTFVRERSLAASPAAETAGESNLATARAAVGPIDLRALLIGLASFAVLFAILGTIAYPGGGDLRVFDLNKEQTFPATFSGVLLLAAGALALLNGLVRSDSPTGRRWWFVLALVFAFLGLDEIAALHEAIQDRVNVWGQAFLAPVVLAGVYAWWVTLRQLRSEPPAGLLFLLGAGAWALSQAIDVGFNEHWGWTVIPEELFEMAGSALFGLALLVALRRLVAQEPAPERAAPVQRAPERLPAPVR